MANQMIYRNRFGGWTLVEVPEDARDGTFYTRPHAPDRHFNTRELALKALRALRTQRDDD